MQMILVIHDLAVGADERVGVEWCVTDQHLVEEDAHGPPVAFATVHAVAALRLENLWRDVVRGSHGRVALDESVAVNAYTCA